MSDLLSSHFRGGKGEMGMRDKEAKVKWLLSAELEQPDSKTIVPRRHRHMALGSFVSNLP